MSQIDKQKEKIAFLRTLFFFLLASIFGLAATVFSKYKQLDSLQFAMVDIAGFFLLFAILATGYKLKKEIDKIEEM